MAIMDYDKSFSCSRCGNRSVIYLVKIAGALAIIKQKCSKHGGKTIKVPLSQEEHYIDIIQDGIFRCFKCGQKSTVDLVKTKGPWTLVRCACPTHGNKLPFQKISSIIYNKISSPEVTAVEPSEPIEPIESTEPETIPSEVASFCPNCGEKIEGTEKYCSVCGAELD